MYRFSNIVHLIVILVSILMIGCDEAESSVKTSVPCIKVREVGKYDPARMIRITFHIDKSGHRIFKINDIKLEDLDSLKTVLIAELERFHIMARPVLSIFLIAAESTPMGEIEDFEMKLRRLGFTNFIYAIRTKCRQKLFENAREGIFTKKPILLTENWKLYCQSKSMDTLKIDNILDPNFDHSELSGSTPHRPTEFYYETYSRLIARIYQKYTKVELFIQDNGLFTYKQKDYSLEELEELLEEKLSKGKCLFLVNNSERTSYRSYVQLYAILKEKILDQRDSFSQKLYKKNYSDLNKEKRERVYFANPHQFIFEPLYLMD